MYYSMETIFESVLYSLITVSANFVAHEYNFFLKMVTLDSLFTAIHFLKTYINQNLSDSQIVLKSNSLYNGSLLDRYIYYSIIFGFYKIVCMFFWQHESPVLYFIGISTIIPFIMNKILITKLFDIIKDKKELLVKIIISKIFARIVKFYSKLYLEKDISIKYYEILCFLKDYRETLNHFINVLKNLVFIFLLLYAKNYSATLYYGIIKYIYNYKTGESLESFNLNNAKSLLIDIIDNRRWSELNKPQAYRAMLCLYQMSNDKSDILKKTVTQFNFSLVKMFTVWTISSLIGNVYIIPILSLCMLLFRRGFRKLPNDILYRELFTVCLTVLISYINTSYVLISCVSQFGTKTLFNKLTYIILKSIYKFSKKTISIITDNNKDLLVSYIITILYILILKHMHITEPYPVIALNIIANVFMSIEIKKQIIFGVTVVSTYISNYNILHIIFNAMVMYIILGLFDRSSFYTLQDTLKILIEHVSYTLKGTLSSVYIVINLLCRFYTTLRCNVRNKLRNIYFRIVYGENADTKLILDLMDIDKFPSITNGTNSINSTNGTNETDIRIIKLDRLLEENENSVSIDDKIFNQPIDAFINGISVDDTIDNKEEFKTRLNIRASIKADCYAIINDYVDRS